MDNDKRVWGIHTKDEKLFLENNKIAIGWNAMGDLTSITPTREAFKDKYMEVYPDAKPGAVPTSAGMLYRFCCEVQIGDYVVYPSRSNRMINICEVTGAYEYDVTQADYAQTRSVKWIKHIPRTQFTQGALYEIGSAMTFFMVKNYTDEFLAALDKSFKGKATAVDDDETIGATAEDIIESTKDFVLKEISKNLKGYPLEELVANLLQAMGYRTNISPHGGDSGIDIIAYKDELPPRIVVQVKSQDSDIKETVIHSLKGAMDPTDYGLFVTLSNYTKNAQKYLDKTPSIRGINGPEFVDLILKYYDLLDDKYKRLIPLKRVYIPVPKEK